MVGSGRGGRTILSGSPLRGLPSQRSSGFKLARFFLAVSPEPVPTDAWRQGGSGSIPLPYSRYSSHSRRSVTPPSNSNASQARACGSGVSNGH